MIKINTLNEIQIAAKQFIVAVEELIPDYKGDILSSGRCIAFYGEMGVGKTTFIKAIANELGVIDTVNSPTFAIINEYHTKTEQIIYHLDFYRIKNEIEAYDLGYEFYFFGNNFCLIEWPEKVDALLPENTISVIMHEEADKSRTINVSLGSD